MDNEQAKFILQAYRAGGQDANDPQFQEALDQVKHDPELARWFEEERALDQAIGAKVKSIPVPADLKANILAGKKVIRLEPWWKKSSVAAVAACLLLLLSAAAYWVHALNSFTRYQRDMTAFLNGLDHLDYENHDLHKVRLWLKDHHGHGEMVLPAALEQLSPEGCRIFQWREKKVVLICFRTTNNNFSGEMHLLVVDRADLSQPPPLGQVVRGQSGHWSTASWSDEKHAYVLAGMVKPEYLDAYVPPTQCH